MNAQRIIEERCKCWDGKTSARVIFNDGGRAKSGYKGFAGDCVIRAIAIASKKPYSEVYEAMKDRNASVAKGRTKVAAKLRKNGSTPRNGNFKKSYHDYILSLGFKWVPTMQVGSGCKVTLCEDDLPKGTIIARLSRHLVAVIDGVIHDTYNPQRETIVAENGVNRIIRRCVYGYYIKAA